MAKQEISNVANTSYFLHYDTSFSKIFGKVKTIVHKILKVDSSAIKLTSSMENDLGADSLDEVEIIMEYEKEFNITVPDKDLCTLTTINDAVLYIQEKLINKTAK